MWYMYTSSSEAVQNLFTLWSLVGHLLECFLRVCSRRMTAFMTHVLVHALGHMLVHMLGHSRYIIVPLLPLNVAHVGLQSNERFPRSKKRLVTVAPQTVGP